MTLSAFAEILDTLDKTFDDASSRDKPLSIRTPITEALEAMLYRMIDVMQPDAFFEIGAYEADFSQLMKTTYPTSAVTAVEANPRVYEHFKDKLSNTEVTYLNTAVGASVGTTSFFIPEVVAGSKMPFAGRMGSLHQIGLRDSEMTEVTVEVTTLDTLTQDLDATKMCLWIDVEGAIKEVLSGASSTLERSAIVYCELESSQVWKEQTLAGEIRKRIEDNGFTLISRDCQKWFQFNALFVKTELLDDPIYQTLATEYHKTAIDLFQ